MSDNTLLIIEKGFELSLELNRLPGWQDWVKARKADKTIPSEWQVYRRFGGSEGAWRLFNYCILEYALEKDKDFISKIN